MDAPLKKNDRKFTYKDYLTWPENERRELIGGIAYDMTPAPSRVHQEILGDLFFQFKNYLKDKSCEVYLAPFDVRFADDKNADDGDISTVIQPDIVVEILSSSTASKDMIQKYKLYESHGVLEYWIVQPLDKTVMVFKSGEDKKFGKPDIYAVGDEIKVWIFDDLAIDLKVVFKG